MPHWTALLSTITTKYCYITMFWHENTSLNRTLLVLCFLIFLPCNSAYNDLERVEIISPGLTGEALSDDICKIEFSTISFKALYVIWENLLLFFQVPSYLSFDSVILKMGSLLYYLPNHVERRWKQDIRNVWGSAKWMKTIKVRYELIYSELWHWQFLLWVAQ